MIENEENKIKNTKKLRSRIKNRVTQLITYYNDAPKEKIDTYRSLIEHLAFIDVMLQVYQEDMLVNGYQVKYMNGKNQWGLKKNESVDLFKKWYSDRLSDSERLKRLLSVDDSGFDKEFDVFINM